MRRSAHRAKPLSLNHTMIPRQCRKFRKFRTSKGSVGGTRRPAARARRRGRPLRHPPTATCRKGWWGLEAPYPRRRRRGRFAGDGWCDGQPPRRASSVRPVWANWASIGRYLPPRRQGRQVDGGPLGVWRFSTIGAGKKHRSAGRARAHCRRSRGPQFGTIFAGLPASQRRGGSNATG